MNILQTLSSKFEFISRDFELPLVDHNEEWLTNKWIYVICGVVGALTGIRSLEYMFMGASFAEASGITLSYGFIFVLSVWSGTTAVAFVKIPVLRCAVARSVFGLIVLSLIFLVCAILGVIGFFLIILIVIGALLGGRSRSGASSASSSSSGNTIYDGEGNIHYTSSEDGDRITTTGGDTMRHMPDGTYRKLNDD